MKKKHSRHTHVDQVLVMIQLMLSMKRSRSQVIHNHEHDFSKRFNLARVYQLPIIGSARTPISLSCYPSHATIFLLGATSSELRFTRKLQRKTVLAAQKLLT